MKMTATDQPTPLGIARILCFVVGFVVYIPSFFLSAAGNDQAPDLPGFACAVLSVSPLIFSEPYPLLAIAGGLVNPLVLCYAAAWIAPAREEARPLLALGIVLGVTSAAGYLLLTHMVVYSGFFVWASGALLMTAGDLLDAVSRWVAAGEPSAPSPISGQ
jgi:hypothetical protein